MSSKIDILTSGYASLLQQAPPPPQQQQQQSDTHFQSESHRKRQEGEEEEEEGDKVKQDKKQRQQQFMRATGSCCLVSSSRSYALFDTMGPWERDSLIDKLAHLRVHPDDIEYLVCSHSHPDHVGNLNLFTRAKKHFVGTSVYSNDLYDLNCFEPIGSYKYKSPREDKEIDVITYEPYRLDSNLSLQPTQGHTMECISMLVDNCQQYARVALVGDLFEREADVKDEAIWLGAGSQNSSLQRANRTRIYQSVDYILPGHGPLFSTKSTELVAGF